MTLTDKDGRSTSDERMACAALDEVGNCFVKASTTEAHILFYNPFNLMGQPGDLMKYDSRSGRYSYEFRPVKRDVYDNYVQFLKTKRDAFRAAAEQAYLFGGYAPTEDKSDLTNNPNVFSTKRK